MGMPTPTESEAYREELEKYYKEFDNDNVESLVNDAMYKYLFESYVNYSSWNMENNDMKMKYINKTAMLLFIFICIMHFYLYTILSRQFR